MGKTIILIWIISLSLLFSKSNIVPLPDLSKPESIHLDDHRFYIVERTSIYIYNLNNFELQKRIGKEGEGPGEFKILPFLPLFINITDKHIVVNSFGKVAFFNKEGTLLNEEKVKGGYIFYIMPLGHNLAGQGGIQEGNNRYRVINIYDNKLNKIKEVCRVIDDFKGPGNGYDVLEKRFRHQTLDNLLLVAEKPDFTIDVYDTAGKKVSSISQKYNRVPMSQSDSADITDYLKNSSRTKTFFPLFKPLRFPSHFPAIMNLYTANEKIYVMTWRRKNRKTEFFVFDKKGQLIKKTFIFLAFQNPVEPSPFAIRNNRLFQLVENEEAEEWELHISDIK
jgi:hypothetical protein